MEAFEPLDSEIVLHTLDLSPSAYEVAAVSSDGGFGIGIVLERATRRMAVAQEFCWADGNWRVERLGWHSGLVVVAGRQPDRAGVASVGRIDGQEFPVQVSREGWWALVAMIDGVEHPRMEAGLHDPN